MIMNSVKTGTATLAGVMGLWVAGMVVAPQATADITRMLRLRLDEAVAPDCQQFPVACLERKAKALRDMSGTLASLRIKLDAETANAVETSARNAQLLAQNRLFLQEGRTVLMAAAPGRPVTFVGVEYSDPEALKSQLQLSFNEGQRLEAAVAEGNAVRDQLAQARRDLIARRSQIDAQLAIIPQKVALVEAQAAYATFAADLTKIDEVLANGRDAASVAVDPVLRTTRELAADASRLTVGSVKDSSFDSWLNGGVLAAP